MDIVRELWDAVFPNLVAEFIVVVVGVLFAHTIRTRWERWRYGNWRVVVLQHGQVLVNRHISPHKAHQILQEPAELSVFLKGVVSPYAWIACDIVEAGKCTGLLTIDQAGRRYIVNLDRNPAIVQPAVTGVLATV